MTTLATRWIPVHPLTLWGVVRETLTRGAFAQHRGFQEVRRAWESRLDVARFDPRPSQDNAGADVRGFRIVTVADEQGVDPRWLEKLHDMHTASAADVPQPQPAWITFEKSLDHGDGGSP